MGLGTSLDVEPPIVPSIIISANNSKMKSITTFPSFSAQTQQEDILSDC